MRAPTNWRKGLAVAAMAALLAGWVTALLASAHARSASAASLDDGRLLLRGWGYRDEIRIAARRGEGSFRELELLSSRESPAYAPGAAIQAYLDRLEGVDPGRLSEVEGISGATVTTDAVRGLLASSAPPGAAAVLRPALCAGLFALALLLPRLGFLAARRGLRSGAAVAVSAAAFLVLGPIWNSPVTVASLASPLALASLAPVLAAASAALLSNVYCRRLCPFGSLERLGARAASPLLGRARASAADRSSLLASLAAGRYVLLGVAVASLALGNELYLEPYAYLFSGRPLWWLYLLPAAALLASAVVPHLWCTAFCPLGAALDLLGRLRRLIAGGPAPVRRHARQAGARAVSIAAAAFGLILLGNLLLFALSRSR